MIKDRQKKTEEIIYTIENRIHEINKRYRTEPDLYFYKRIVDQSQVREIITAPYKKKDGGQFFIYDNFISI